MKIEDLVIHKAFISTSEYPIITMSWKGKQCKNLMSMMYNKLIKNQCREDKCRCNKAPEASQKKHSCQIWFLIKSNLASSCQLVSRKIQIYGNQKHPANGIRPESRWLLPSLQDSIWAEISLSQNLNEYWSGKEYLVFVILEDDEWKQQYTRCISLNARGAYLSELEVHIF